MIAHTVQGTADDGAYDVVVLGAGAGGQRAAITAVKAGRTTLLVESHPFIGGSCVNTGTIPSKSLREAALYLSGYREQAYYGQQYAVKQHITMADLLQRAQHVMEAERTAMESQVYRNGIDLVYGSARFTDTHTLVITRSDGAGTRVVHATAVIIATGTEPAQVAHAEVDDQAILTSESLLGLEAIPKSLAVVGAGVIGCEYASIFATVGTRVTLIDARAALLPFVDREIIEDLMYHLREHDVTLRLGETVQQSEVLPDGTVRTTLASGKEITTDRALHSIGRVGATAQLNLPAVGLAPDKRGRIVVNAHFQTTVLHIYAVGDVIGFPSLASTSMEQGRLAAAHACGLHIGTFPPSFPYGIYTIPEISMCGKTEEELTNENVPYEIGKAAYKEVARAMIIGDAVGTLKLLFDQHTHKLLGVHIIGELASELVHIGQTVMAFGGTIDFFVNAVFNYPTLTELYKIAALNGFNRLGLSAHDALTPDAAPTVVDAGTVPATAAAASMTAG